MTELQFLIHLLVDHRLKPELKKLIAERIKEVEEQGRKPSQQIVPRGTLPPMQVGGITQAPSTIALMEKHGLVPPMDVQSNASEVPNPTHIAAPQATLATNRIIGGEKSTGNGTRGPRKF